MIFDRVAQARSLEAVRTFGRMTDVHRLPSASGGRLIPFTKAHACGNDFLIVTEEAAAGHDRAALTRRLCQRNTGIGADGIEFFAWKTSRAGPKSGRIRLHNADGSIAEISGNGTRCVAAWMAESLGSQARRRARNRHRRRPARLPHRQRAATTMNSPSKSPPAWACPGLCRTRSS